MSDSPIKQDSPIKSNAQIASDYIEMRQRYNDLKRTESIEVRRRLIKQGLSPKEAEDAITNALKHGKDPMRINTKDIKSKALGALKTYRNIGFLGGCLPFLIAFMCALPLFLIVALAATAISNPTSILDVECQARGAINADDGVKCVRDKYLNNNGTSFGNQGLTI